MPTMVKNTRRHADFAKSVIWWSNNNDIHLDLPSQNYMLAMLLGRNGTREQEAREKYGYTDEDFREALRHAPAGSFMTLKDWEATNRRFGIDPPLPFPRPAWVIRAEEQRKGA